MAWLPVVFVVASITLIVMLYLGPHAMKKYMNRTPKPELGAADILKQVLGNTGGDLVEEVFNAVKKRFKLDNISELTNKELDDLKKLSDDDLKTMGFRDADIKRLKG
jgi:hypothetical protein